MRIYPPEVAPAPAPAPAAAPTPAASGRFVVNLGSFANAANATALADRLKARGIAVSSEAISVDGKPAQRLRAGPYRTRAEADAPWEMLPPGAWRELKAAHPGCLRVTVHR